MVLLKSIKKKVIIMVEVIFFRFFLIVLFGDIEGSSLCCLN